MESPTAKYFLCFFLFLSSSYAGPRHVNHYCTKPSVENLQSLLSSYHHQSNVSIIRNHFTCLAVRGRYAYQSASLLAEYTTTSNNSTIAHFELECKMNAWKMTTFSETRNTSLFDLETRYNCFQCIVNEMDPDGPMPPMHHHKDVVIDEVAHCRECNVACHGWGGGHCKSPSVGSCCPYFDANGNCTQECPNNWTGEKCTNCTLTCYNGGTPDGDCFSCICVAGFTSAHCNETINQCDYTNPCQNNGTCMEDSNGNVTCICPEGYIGNYCEIRDPCVPNPCQNNGICMKDNENYICICPEGYMGTHCETENLCEPNPCQNGGVCKIVNGTSFECECPTGLTGLTCSLIPDKCSSVDVPCYHGGECQDTDDGYYCNCSQTGYTGPMCDVDECVAKNPCKNGGTCENVPREGIRCNCPPEYTSPDCSMRIDDPCNPSPCLNGGICFVNGSSAQCRCREGWTGDLCEVCDNSRCGPIPTSTDISHVDSGRTNIGLIIAIVFGIIGFLMVISLLSLLALLYRRYGLHRDTVKTAGITNEAWDGNMMVNPIYMTPELLASTSVPFQSDVIVNKSALKVEDDD